MSVIEEQIPKKTKISYGTISAASWALSNMAFSPITFYYNIKLGLGAGYISLAWLIFAVWNAVNDPLFGILQDRTRSKLGRRIPYIRYGAPFLGLFFILLWTPVIGLDQLTLFLYFLFILLAFDTCYSAIGIAHASLLPEIAFSESSRAKLAVYANLLTAIGTGVSFVLPLVLLTGTESTDIHPLLYPSVILLAVLCSTFIFLLSHNLNEKKYIRKQEILGLVESFKYCLKNKPWLIAQAGWFSYTICNTIFLTGIYYYIEYIVKLTGFLVIIPLLIVYGMVILFTFILDPLMKRYSAKKLYVFGLLITGSSLILLFIIGWSLLPAMFALIPLGIGFGAVSILGPVVGAETMDYDETITGKRREGTYGGIGALINKPSISIANALFLSTISFFNFIDGAGVSQQPESAFLGVMIGFTIVPAIFAVISGLIFMKFPLDGPEWEEKKLKLKEIHDNKEKEFLIKDKD